MRRMALSPIRWLTGGSVLAAAVYASYVGIAWWRYGRTNLTSRDGSDDVHLENLMAVYDVVERFQVRVAAPAELMFSVACNLNLLHSDLIRAIFKAREFVLGG